MKLVKPETTLVLQRSPASCERIFLKRRLMLMRVALPACNPEELQALL
ncbi:MAG TPA: hypothetical protein V6D11_28985 [Waterburya sp.]